MSFWNVSENAAEPRATIPESFSTQRPGPAITNFDAVAFANPIQIALAGDDRAAFVGAHIHIESPGIAILFDFVARNPARDSARHGSYFAAVATTDLVSDHTADDSPDNGSAARGATIAIPTFDALDDAAIATATVRIMTAVVVAAVVPAFVAVA